MSPLAAPGRARRTQAQRRQETEQRVLAATQRLVIERGVRALTLSRVGEAAGYSRGIVNHAFGTRQELIRTLAEKLQDRLALEVEQANRRGLDRVLDWIEGYLSAFASRSEDARAFLVLWSEAITSEPELRPIFVERDERFRAAIAREIRHGCLEGSIRREVDPAAMALCIVGQLRGIGMQLLLAPAAVDLDALKTATVDAVRRGLAA